jgi:hypothetical protein
VKKIPWVERPASSFALHALTAAVKSTTTLDTTRLLCCQSEPYPKFVVSGQMRPVQPRTTRRQRKFFALRPEMCQYDVAHAPASMGFMTKSNIRNEKSEARAGPGSLLIADSFYETRNHQDRAR